MHSGEALERTYCTYFDSAYLPRGRVLVETLRRVGDRGPIYILALDDDTLDEVSTWESLNATGVSLTTLESTFPELAAARDDRNRMEYVFTLTPWFIRWVMQHVDPGTWVTYLDADMAFYSSTDDIFTTLGKSSVGIVEHRFTWEQRWRRKYGRFNVAWVSFRRNTDGLNCLEWWCNKCLEWCRDEVDQGRFADQGYLDHFPELFSGVNILQLPGADLAPWNLRRHTVTTVPGGQVLVDEEPLIFFHFHGLRRESGRYYFKHLPYLARTTATVRESVYRPYCEALEQATPSELRTSTLERRLTLFSALRSGRVATLRWLGERRGDFVDIPIDEPPQ